MLDRRELLKGACLAIAASLATPQILRAQIRTGTARIIVGFSAGGSLDTIARLLADQIKGYANAIIVENRTGASGRLALTALKTAPADGSVFVLTPGEQLSLFPHIYRTLNYDPQRDFAPVSTVCAVQFLIAVGPMVPASVTSLSEFVAWCRDNPRLASYATPGAGTRHHFFGQMLGRAAGFEFIHVPYRGAAPALQDVVGGQIASTITVTQNAVPHIEAGRMRALVTSGPIRSAVLPNVPTAREAGFAALESVEWFGLVLPRNTPRDMIAALSAATQAVVGSPEFKSVADRLSVEPRGSTPEQFDAIVRDETSTWAEVVKSSGFSPLD